MKNTYKYCVIFVMLVMFVSTSHAVTNIPPEYSTSYNPKSNPFEDGRNALALAKKTNRRVLIEVGGDWCVYCHLLDRFIHTNPEVKKRFYNTFVLLKVNYSDENRNKEFLSGFERIRGYPHLFITESSGKVIYSKGMDDMTIKGTLSKKMMFKFLERWKIRQPKL